MRVVTSWLREFAPTQMPTDELAERISRQGVKVEGVLRPWDGLQGVVVARVVDVGDHPDSTKLCVATVDDGAGEHQVVVGVRNMRAGDLVPWARPGARVPVLDEALGARELRGVVSNGMLCSPRELNIADVHTGILLLNDEDLEVGADLKAGLGLDDEVLDIEVEPNRPDFLSVLGVAREVAAATGVPLVEPEIFVEEIDEAAAGAVSIAIEGPAGCPHYVARIMRAVDLSGTSPLKVQARLTASGMRPVSNVVDATNYVMLELGQPLHAFDMDRLAGPGIVVRYAEEGEHITTLDDVDRALTAEDLLICDLERPVAIGGVMGGATSEVSATTTNVLLESAFFERSGVLRTARRLGLPTEASHRFERGTDPEGSEAAAARCAGLIRSWAGGEVLSGVAAAGQVPNRRWVSMRPSRASMLLDYEVSDADAQAVFDTLRMANRSVDGAIEVEVPGYRWDIEREVDLIEEVARMQGYDRIDTRLASAAQAGGVPAGYAFRERLKDVLVRAGLRELRPIPFAAADDLVLTGDDDAIAIANPLQAEESFFRTRLTPGLLRAVARNQAWGVETVTVFEVGTVFRTADPVDERPKVGFALCGPAERAWWSEPRALDVIDAKGVLDALMSETGVQDWDLGESPGGPFHPTRSASILVNGDRAGVVGEVHPRVARDLEIEGRVAIAEIEVEALMAATQKEFVFRDVPRFPPVRRDLAFTVPEEVPAGAVEAALREAAGERLTSCVLFDVHRGDPLPDGTKGLAFDLEFRATDRTLTGEETAPIVERIVARLRETFGAELRSG